jgi:hypothetical protein
MTVLQTTGTAPKPPRAELVATAWPRSQPILPRIQLSLLRTESDSICERFHKTVLNEFYRVVFRKKVYRFIDELLADLAVWIHEYK